MVVFVRSCFVKMTLRLFQPSSVVMTMVLRLLRHFRRSARVSQIFWCYNLLNSQKPKCNYQSITVKKDWLIGHFQQLKKLRQLHQKKNNNWPRVSFINNGSEITIWIEYNFKTQSVKPKATFLR